MSTAVATSLTNPMAVEPIPSCPAEKPTASLTPPTPPVPLCHRKDSKTTQESTFIVNIKALASDVANAIALESAPGEHSLDLSPSPPDRSFSPLHIDGCAAESSGIADAADTLIAPPGLSKPSDIVDDSAVALSHATDPIPCGEPCRQARGQSSKSTPAAEAAHVHDSLLDVDESVFEHDLSRFSLDGVDPLETFIPPDLFPDELLVHDLDNITNRCPTNVPDSRTKHRTDVPVRYVRVRPEPASSIPSGSRRDPKTQSEGKEEDGKGEGKENDDGEGDGTSGAEPTTLPPPTPLRIAHLYLSASNKLGSGSHSTVFRAALRLRLDPVLSPGAEDDSDASGWRTVSVAAKVADARCNAHAMISNESRFYDGLSRELMDDTARVEESEPTATEPDKGDNRVDEASPQASSGQSFSDCPEHEIEHKGEDGHADGSDVEDSEADEVSSSTTERVEEHLPAIVPKFFGYYCAMGEDGYRIMQYHEDCSLDAKCDVDWPTRILLLEECGTSMRQQCRKLPHAQREECLTLVERLHAVAGYTNNSMYLRNMLVQPGPLNVPRSERTMERPSFRLIDFGRAVSRKSHESGFESMCESDLSDAVDSLSL